MDDDGDVLTGKLTFLDGYSGEKTGELLAPARCAARTLRKERYLAKVNAGVQFKNAVVERSQGRCNGRGSINLHRSRLDEVLGTPNVTEKS